MVWTSACIECWARVRMRCAGCTAGTYGQLWGVAALLRPRSYSTRSPRNPGARSKRSREIAMGRTSHPELQRGLAFGGLIAPFVFVAAVIVTAAARPDYRHDQQMISLLGEARGASGRRDELCRISSLWHPGSGFSR